MTQDIDIELQRIGNSNRRDVVIGPDGDFGRIKGLDTALLMSIYCERRADASEVPASTERRGWWGNDFTVKLNFEIGSKIWLFHQSRLTLAVIEALRDAAVRGLDWLVEDGIAIEVNASVEQIEGVVTLAIDLTRPSSQVERRFFDLWENTPA